jgi:hypothetical protein
MTRQLGWPSAVGLAIVVAGGVYPCTVPAPSSPAGKASGSATTSEMAAPGPMPYVPRSGPTVQDRAATPVTEDADGIDLGPRIDLHHGDDDDDHHHRHRRHHGDKHGSAGHLLHRDGKFGHRHHLLHDD